MASQTSNSLISPHLETRLQSASVLPDVSMVDGVVLFAPVSYLKNAADCHETTPADTDDLFAHGNVFLYTTEAKVEYKTVTASVPQYSYPSL